MKHTNAQIEYQFKFIEERWRDIWGSGKLLSDVENELEIIVDENCTYARFYQTEFGRTIVYHVYGGDIRILINYDKEYE